MVMAEFTQIRYEVSESIATVALNRPEKMNAFTGVMMRELLDVFDIIDADDTVRAVIVTGEGRRFVREPTCRGAQKRSTMVIGRVPTTTVFVVTAAGR